MSPGWMMRSEKVCECGVPRGPATELRMSPQETILSVQEGGLQYVKTVEIPPYHYGAVFRRATE